MLISNGLTRALLVLSASSTALAAWSFTDATVSVQARGSTAGTGSKQTLSPNVPLAQPVTLGSADILKIALTTQEGKTAKRAHQAALLLEDPHTKLDISYPFSVKDSGKATLSLSLKDLPSQFLRSKTPIAASLIVASFGPSSGYKSSAFVLSADPDASVPVTEKPLRYGKLEEIHHIFKSDPKSPPAVISLVFAAASLATLPVLFGSWLYIGGNVNHLQKALSAAPISHVLFVGSIAGVEGVLFLYYTSWRLFTALPVLGVLAVVAVISGSRALTEVQERRLAGLR